MTLFQHDILYITILLGIIINIIAFFIIHKQVVEIPEDVEATVEDLLDLKLGNYLADDADRKYATCTDCAFFTEVGICTLGDINASKYQNVCAKYYKLDCAIGERIAQAIYKPYFTEDGTLSKKDQCKYIQCRFSRKCKGPCTVAHDLLADYNSP